MEGTRRVRISTAERDRDAESTLMKELGVPRLVATVLVRRGYGDPAAADAFLNPKLDDLGDPKLLPDFEAARDVVLGAIERKEKIYVHGDYDVDGVSSAAMFGRFLEKVGADVHVHVPHRMKEGYGIHMQSVEEARELGAKVFLTCDCGIGAHEQVDAARDAGMVVVVTDHHSVPPDLPEAAALINPHRADSKYPFRELCGAGVVFRFCEGLAAELGASVAGFQRAYLDFAVLGTVADVMPLVGENRVIAKYGLEQLWNTKKEGLRALLETSNLAEKVTDGLRAHHIGFQIGPRLNATGRIDDAGRALELLMSRDYAKALDIAVEIERLNTERRSRQDLMIQQALEMVEAMDLEDRFVIVVGHEEWHSGIIGLVASKLVDRFHRPAFVMSFNPDTGMARCSARSIPGLHLAELIRAFPNLVEGGGHAAAAGFSTRLDLVERVFEAFNDYAKGVMTAEDLIPELEVDAAVDGDEVTYASVLALSQLEPFGCGNPEPLFTSRNVKLLEAKATKNEAVARVRVQAPGGAPIWGVTFQQATDVLAMVPESEFSAAFRPVLEEYNGTRSLKLRFEHIEV